MRDEDTATAAADERWRDVLFELVRRATQDPEFRARVEATGAVIDNIEAILERGGRNRGSGSGTVACRPYWWGFELEIPHAVLAEWKGETIDASDIVTAMGDVVGPATSFRRRAAMWIAARVDELQRLDQGYGVYASMTWMAPNIFVAMPIRR